MSTAWLRKNLQYKYKNISAIIRIIQYNSELREKIYILRNHSMTIYYPQFIVILKRNRER